jgi:hypothetical protein
LLAFRFFDGMSLTCTVQSGGSAIVAMPRGRRYKPAWLFVRPMVASGSEEKVWNVFGRGGVRIPGVFGIFGDIFVMVELRGKSRRHPCLNHVEK